MGGHEQPGRPFTAGIGAAIVALATAGASYGGRSAFTGAVFVVQLLLTLAWFAVLDTPGSFGGFVIVVAAAAAGDLLLLDSHGAYVGRLAGVVGIALVGGLAHQLLRRHRSHVTESLSGSVSAVLLTLALAMLVGLRGGRGGREAVAAALIGSGTALLIARLTDVLVRRPLVAPAGTRGWPGLVAGLVVGSGAAAGYGSAVSLVGASVGVRLGAITAALALLGDVALDLGRQVLARGGDERQLAALTPVTVLLPLALGCPAAYVAGRILLG